MPDDAGTPRAPTEQLQANASSRQLARNFASGYAGLVVSLVLSVFLTPIVLRHLGASNYGLWIGITAMGTYIGILDIGVATAAVREIAAAIALRDDERLAEVLAAIRFFFTMTGALSVGVGFILAPFVTHLFHLPPGTNTAARVGVILIGVITGLGFITTVPSAILYGGGRSDLISFVSVAGAAVVQGAQIITVLLGGGVVGLFVVAAGGGLLSFAATDIAARRSGLVVRRKVALRWPILREIMIHGFRNAAVGIGGMLAYSLDAVVIGLILPVGRIAPYDVALSTANLSRSLSTAGTNLLMPSYAHASAVNDNERQFRLYVRAIALSMAVAIPMVAALIAVGPGLLHVWLHTVPPDTYTILIALNVLLILELPGHQSFILLMGIRRNKLLSWIGIPLGIANVGLSIPATYWLGPIGPAVGSMPQIVIVELIVLPIICCRCLHQPLKRYLSLAMRPLIAPVLASAIVGGLLGWQFHRDTGPSCIAVAVVITLVGWAAYLGYVWKAEPDIRAKVVSVVNRVRTRHS